MKPSLLLPLALGRVAPGCWACASIPADADALFAGLDWEVISLDLGESRDVTDTLKQLGTAADFPSYYGANLDAAYDCLTDLPPSQRVIIIRGTLDAKLAEVFADYITAAAPQPTVVLTDAASKSLGFPEVR